MAGNPENEWPLLEARAMRLLEHAKEAEPRAVIRHYGSLLRLWHYPAYGPQVTWTVLTPGRKVPASAGPLVREIVWNSAADRKRGLTASANPTMTLREAAIPTADLRRLLDEGAALAVPVVGVEAKVGLDGDYFGLETYEVSPNVRLQWWRDGPMEWRHFIDWVAGLRSFLIRCLDQAG